jgi:hypothetical protein
MDDGGFPHREAGERNKEKGTTKQEKGTRRKEKGNPWRMTSLSPFSLFLSPA